MKLYHGGPVAVPQPEIRPPAAGRTLDFGAGFYTTTSLEPARRWVALRRRRGESADGYVSVYDIADDILAHPGLKCLVFPAADRAWLEFVMRNRGDPFADHGFDIVSGPVANDRVFATLTLFETGQLDAGETIRRLKTYRLVDQFLFHTPKALEFLEFAGSEAVHAGE